jgi:hypothetical protein
LLFLRMRRQEIGARPARRIDRASATEGRRGRPLIRNVSSS